ncbi:putative leucine-rich repeat 2 [Helianthus anomalus]
MHLRGCALYQQRSFNEFGYLTTLHLESIWMYETMLLRLLSSCPLLKSLTLDHASTIICDDGDTTIVDLFECLPVIEYLYVVFSFVEVILSTWYILD